MNNQEAHEEWRCAAKRKRLYSLIGEAASVAGVVDGDDMILIRMQLNQIHNAMRGRERNYDSSM